MNGKEINLTSDDINITSENLKIDNKGNITIESNDSTPSIQIKSHGGNVLELYPSNFNMEYSGLYNFIQKGGFFCGAEDGKYIDIWGAQEDPRIVLNSLSNKTEIKASGITTPVLTQTSLEEIKKNISLYTEDVSDIIKNSEIYIYNLKNEKDTDKKHIGFVIGDKYKTPKQVLSKGGKGIDLYSMSSLMWKNAQEQQKTIEMLLKRIQELEEKING